MNLNEPVATARQLYQLLSEVARSLQNCDPESNSAVESAITSRVAQEIIAILEDDGHPVAVIKMTEMGRYFIHGIEYSTSLSHMFLNHDYESVVTTVQEILEGLEGSEVEND